MTDDIQNPLFDKLVKNRSSQTPTSSSVGPVAENGDDLANRMLASRQKTYQESQPDSNAPMAWSDVGSQAVGNFIPSAGKAAYGMVEPFLPENWEKTGQAVKGIGQGLYSKAQGVAADYGLAQPQNPEDKERNEASVNAIGDYYKNRYGSMAGFQHALAEDPAGVLMDASVPLTLGESALAKVPGLVGKVAKKGILTAATNPLTAPLMAAKGVNAAAKAIPVLGDMYQGISKIPGASVEALTGISNKSLGEAFSAGREGGILSGDEAFTGQMRGTAPRTAIVDKVRSAISDIADERSQDYLSGMSSLRKGRGAPINDVVQSGIDLLNATSHSPQNYAVAQKVGQAIVDFQNGKIGPAYTFSPGRHTLHELDLLKRNIREIARDPTMPGGAIAMDTANKVKDTISKIDPKYADIMEQYADASDQLSDANRLFGNPKMTPERQLQKILSGKNNVTKQTLLDQLSEREPDIAKMIAGQEFSRPPNYSMTDFLPGFGASSALTYGGVNPLVAGGIGLATLPLKTPRFMGEAAYYAGKGSKLAPIAAASGELSQLERPNKQPAAPSVNPFTASMEKAYARPQQPAKPSVGDYFTAQDRAIANKTKIDDELRKMGLTPLPRASGGRTTKNPKDKAQRLIDMVDKIKKEQGNETKPLLNLDDTTVAKALAIANRGI
jgi:hypothetical protein